MVGSKSMQPLETFMPLFGDQQKKEAKIITREQWDKIKKING